MGPTSPPNDTEYDAAAGPRTCLITGASSGIGEAVAHRLAARGHRLALGARSSDRVAGIAAALPTPTLAVPGDVTSGADIDAMFGAVENTWGPVEVLVISAGAGLSAPLVDTTDDEWQQMLAINLTAPFRCIRRALPAMAERRWGRIVVVASVVAKRGAPRIAAYTASKHGVLGLVRSAAAEFARSGITVNAVCPGYVDTPMTDATIAAVAQRTGRTLNEARAAIERQQPNHRLVTPAEVAAVVELCVVNGAINGQGINVDGGTHQSRHWTSSIRRNSASRPDFRTQWSPPARDASTWPGRPRWTSTDRSSTAASSSNSTRHCPICWRRSRPPVAGPPISPP
jgi:NAD(P)-dependent dehydrogenase (short-subunit alcohol dehydrogenase family)